LKVEGEILGYTLKFRHHFDSAHRLVDYDGPCATIHGHRWEVEVTIDSDVLLNDMVADFTTLRRVIDRLDHGYLNDKVDFNPTAENLAKYLKEQIDKETGLSCAVTLWESPEASITYK
jgi:6-pyruvoyltetrahydropterin/6-carboxytetrahydropterin synthase